jgi:sensor histidine kinase YesM
MKRMCIFLIVLLALSSCKNGVSYEVAEPVYRTGDNMEWARKNYIDTGWAKERGTPGAQIFWARCRFVINDRINGQEHLGVMIHSFGAYDAYWDGVLIGNNGRIANGTNKEIPGTEGENYMVPDSLAKKGEHVVALRTTQTSEENLQRGVGIKLENYKELLRVPLIIASFMNLMAGAFFIAAVYYFFLYINSRRKEYPILIFGIICLLFFTLLVFEYIKFYINIPYNFFYVRLEFIGWLTFLIAFLVPFYFTLQFSFRQKKLLLILLLISLIAVYVINYHHYDDTARYYSYAMWLAALIIVANGIIKAEKGGLIVFIGLIASAVVNYFLLYDFGLFISFMIIVLCMLYLHSIRARAMEEEYRASLLLSSRLQLELLKKNIQPHFLRNTLTSLIDWVEESPKQGAIFIQALAEEFDIMNEIAEATLIPVRQEIELCKKHLLIMQFRKELQYEWSEEGIDEHEQIPPAILHTIVENGITHSIAPAGGCIKFKLCFERTARYKMYTLETFAENRPEITGRNGGTGFRYIRARLTESFGDRWEFHSVPTGTGQLNTIKIFS